MSYQRRASTAPGTSLTAAAESLASRLAISTGSRVGEAWQQAAWDFYDAVPELRAAARITGQTMSQVRLNISRIAANGEPVPLELAPEIDGKTNPDASHPALKLLSQFAGGSGGQSSLLDSLGVTMTVTGEAILVGSLNPLDQYADDFARVQSYSPEQVVIQNRQITVKLDESSMKAQRIVNEDDPALPMRAIRVWRPHPRKSWQADSAARAAMSALQEIVLYDQHIEASAISRLISAGLLMIPEGMTLPGLADDDGTLPDADPFMRFLIKVMSTAIGDRTSAAARVPIMLRGEADDIAAAKLLSFSTPFDDKIPELRSAALGRLATSVDMPGELLSGYGALQHWCLDEQTEILTHDRGWINHADLIIGDTVYTYDPMTELGYWQPVLDMYRADVVDLPMLSMESKSHSSLSTLNHRWPLQDGTWTTSDMIKMSDKLVVQAADTGTVVAKYDDEFVNLVAVFASDGDKVNSTIRQAKPSKVAETRRILTALYGPADAGTTTQKIVGWREGSYLPRPPGKLVQVRFSLGAEAKFALWSVMDSDKTINREFVMALTVPQCRMFLDTFVMAGDGSLYDGTYNISQKNAERLDAIAIAAIRCGMTVRWSSRGATGFGTAGTVSVHCREQQAANDWNREATVVPYTGTVWCPVTQNQTWLARRNGTVYFTGNTGALVTQDWVNNYLPGLMTFICQSITTGWLYPALAEIDPSIPADVIIWYDTSGIRIRENVGPEAFQAYDRNEINGIALRRALGYDDADAPDADELKRQLLIEMAKKQPKIAPLALAALGYTFTEAELQEAAAISDALGTAATVPGDVPTPDATGVEPGGVAEPAPGNGAPAGLRAL